MKVELTKDDISTLKHFYAELMSDFQSIRDYAISRKVTLAEVYMQAKYNVAELDQKLEKLNKGEKVEYSPTDI